MGLLRWATKGMLRITPNGKQKVDLKKVRWSANDVISNWKECKKLCNSALGIISHKIKWNRDASSIHTQLQMYKRNLEIQLESIEWIERQLVLGKLNETTPGLVFMANWFNDKLSPLRSVLHTLGDKKRFPDSDKVKNIVEAMIDIHLDTIEMVLHTPYVNVQYEKRGIGKNRVFFIKNKKRLTA